jgi:RimJ/RimL family protein N-acetyltransferase
MGADAICVREATASDAAALFAWRNHGSVRVFARHTEPIAPADHQAWLRAVLADPDRVLLIGERHGRAVGVVRFDIAKTVAEVSIYRVPDVPDRGIGAPLMRAAEERLLVLKPHVTSIKAEVVGDNESSHQMLRDAGYHRRATVWEKHIRS